LFGKIVEEKVRVGPDFSRSCIAKAQGKGCLISSLIIKFFVMPEYD
jgi:hypothetical protein